MKHVFGDVLLRGSWALSPPNFIVIGNDDFYTNLCAKVHGFELSRIPWRDQIGKIKTLELSFYLFFLHAQQCCMRVSQVFTPNNGGGKACWKVVCFSCLPSLYGNWKLYIFAVFGWVVRKSHRKKGRYIHVIFLDGNDITWSSWWRLGWEWEDVIYAELARTWEW